MSPIAQKVLKDALRLSESERASLATELLGSLEPDLPSQQRTEKEWLAEVERRAKAYRQGQLTPKPADEVFREVRAKLNNPWKVEL